MLLVDNFSSVNRDQVFRSSYLFELYVNCLSYIKAGVMASLSHTMSQKKYSWWWDSHISPKNSRWLQENLTDMDSKVKSMIKLIEEDADSFARRAEMYYKKRPELMKMVEEFYRAYRALAERYDHATGALRQAHRTMSVAFPNQIPMMLPDDAPELSDFEANPRTPETSTPVHAFSDVDNLHKNGSGFSRSRSAKKSGQFAEALDSLKQLNVPSGSGENAKITEGRARKGLNFQENMESEQVSKYEKEIINLKETISKLEVEKEAGQEQYQQDLETLSKLEAAVSRAQEDSREHKDKASKAEAEAEAEALKETLSKMEAEKEASLLQYQLCLDNISNLENVLSNAQKDSDILSERADKAEIEAQTVKQDLARVESEKDDVLNQYKLSLEMISELRNKLLLSEESARMHSERAEKAEAEVEMLKQDILKLTKEKDAAALKYQQCLETISVLELKISSAHEETQRISGEMDKQVDRLMGAEERCIQLETTNQSLHSDLETLLLKMTNQDQELTEKQKELGRLWTCIQEERLRFIEAETAFQTLQHLHSKTQDELRSLAFELQNRTLVVRELESHKESLQDEIWKIKEENKGLNELNQSSAMSMEGMQSEILSLREMNGKLGEDVELRVDQRNALQQEIYCLKQELKDLNDKQDAVFRQVNAVGLTPECIETSVKILQDDNSNLRELYEKEKREKVTLIEKLEIFEKLLEKNSLLENSLADMSVELEAVRGKIFVLEESCESLLQEKSTLVDEKATLMTQLQLTTDNLLNISATNTILQNSFSHAHDRLEEIKAKTTKFEDSCILLDSQTSSLISEKDVLVSEFETLQQRLMDYEKITIELEEKFILMEKEKNCALDEVQELKVSLEAEKQEHECFAEMSAKRLAGLETQVHHLEEERWSTNRELQNELDKALNSQMENFVLQSCVKDLGGTNSSLLLECHKLLEESKKSEILVFKLEKENVEQKAELKAVSDKLSALRISMHQFLMALDSIPEYECKEENEQEEMNMDLILKKLQDFKRSFSKSEDEKHLQAIEISILVTLLSEMRSETANIATEKSITDQELASKSGQCMMVQCEVQKLLEITEKLRSDVINGCQKEKELMTEIDNLSQKLLDMEMAHKNIQDEKTHALDENRFLLKQVTQLEEEKHTIEEENHTISGEMFSLSLLTLLLKNYVHERSLEIKEISEDLRRFQLVNTSLEKRLSIQEEKLEDLQSENQHLGETVQKSEDELHAVTCVVSQLSHEIESVKNLFHQKEMELLEAEQKLTIREDEKTGLTIIVEELKSKENMLQIIRNDLEKQIGKFEEDNVHLNEKNRSLGEANHSLEVQLRHLHDKYEKTKSREAGLCSEIQERNEEIDMWETQATVFYGEFQTSTVQMLFMEKFHELIKECKSLHDETTSKDVKMEVLERKISIVEGQNKELEARLALYGPALTSLMDSISSLEKHTFPHAHLDNSVSQEIKDAKLANQQLAASDPSEDNALVSDEILNMQQLQARVKTIENVIVQMESLAMEENTNLHSKLESALRQIDEMRSESRKFAESIKQPSSEISEENGLLPKDIMLDHVSETSSYGISKRRYDGSDMQIYELWENTDQDSSIDLTASKGKNVVDANITKQHTETRKRDREYFSSNSLVEKELGVDKLEISKRFTQLQHDGNKRKVLERLNSDFQKLTNLQITVQDLRKKVESIEKSRKSKAIPESNTIKGKLEEAETAIQKLFDFNGKLMKNIEDISSESGQKSAVESEESSSVRRKRISEQALRVSERIGRLQLEMQRIQFELLKLDDEKESKGKIRIVESKRRVLLQDYLYGGGRKIPKRKKAPFCACVEPRTKGD